MNVFFELFFNFYFNDTNPPRRTSGNTRDLFIPFLNLSVLSHFGVNHHIII